MLKIEKQKLQIITLNVIKKVEHLKLSHIVFERFTWRNIKKKIIFLFLFYDLTTHSCILNMWIRHINIVRP